ncbi:PfkB family carbohydrate kinase [Pelovirga terrestris]|uniref:Carbohydrate kinase n=1 Tax=Pelovirga terrestris TaxID=2771352 RepID=A0A8J6QKH8_9BACT|nr:PfkB family carbohydrate kinase [Pelovirga terrestris]MBD1399904.1 carbohydrate kinase [Pelovirga terrestris]
MSDQQIIVFGEVLFDCFPTGEQILGGAPFNVAWHLAALGADPCLVSAIGDDDLGRQILSAMNNWNMRTDGVQINREYPTGRVEVQIADGQPAYQISEGVAYDHIRADLLPAGGADVILYHGTLALRHKESQETFDALAGRHGCRLFVDINLRSPWWEKGAVIHRIKQARWAKMNSDELRELGFDDPDTTVAMAELMAQTNLEQLIVTRGADGALVRTRTGELIPVAAPPIKRYIDTVGAGDAFSAVYLHGLMTGRAIEKNIALAQQLAANVIGMRGAIPTDATLYHPLTTTGCDHV